MSDRTDKLMQDIISAWEQLKPAMDAIVADYEKDPGIEVGSAEWALGMMKQGKRVILNDPPAHYLHMVDGKVCNRFDDPVPSCYPEKWLSAATPTGWQLYTPAPLLEGAKVNDFVKCREGIMQITSTTESPAPIKCQHELGVMYYLPSGYPCTGEHPDWKITKLIQQGTPEWQEIHTAELLKKYPNIERDLSTVREGDTVLFDNGITDIVIENTGSQFNTDGICGYYNWLYNGKQEYNLTKATCLGIIERAKPKQYGFTEAFDLMDSDKAKRIRRIGWATAVPNVVKDGGYGFRWEIDYNEHILLSYNINATDWVVVK